MILVIYSVIGVLYIMYHYIVNEFVAKASSKNVKNYSKVPVAILVFGLTLTFLSLFHFFKNAALRNFAMKLIRNEKDSCRSTLRRSVTAKPYMMIPKWMSQNRNTQAQPPTCLLRQTQKTKLSAKRKRSSHQKSDVDVDDNKLEDLIIDQPPTVQI